MHTSIHVHDLTINSLSNSHDDLPPDTKMSVQIVIDGYIFLQTMPVETEPSANSWKVKVDCKLPNFPFFECLVIRHERLHRLIGWVQIRRDKALISKRLNYSFSLKLIKVNHDGPLLELRPEFSLCEPSTTEKFNVYAINLPDSRVTSLDYQAILRRLMPIFAPGSGSGTVLLTILETRMMHGRILLLSPRNENRKILLQMLGDISCRQWAQHAIEHLNQAILVYGDAVREDPQDAASLVGFGFALRCRFEQLGNVEDINDSVLALQKSATNSAVAARSFVLNMLGRSLFRRFERFGALDDLNRSLYAFRDSDDLTPSGDPDKPDILSGLGMALKRKFERFGDVGDLVKSISAGEDALRLAGDGYPDRSLLLQQLGTSLLSQFQRLGDLDSLDRSVSLLEESLRLTPHGLLNRWAKLANLGHALRSRFERMGDLADLHRSVLVGRQGVCIAPEDHIDKPSALNNHGISLLTRFERLGNLEDLDDSIAMCENAVRLTPETSPDKPLRMQNLGNSLSQRFQRLGCVDDLQRTISLFENAVRLTPDDHPDKPGRLQNLGNSLSQRFRRLSHLDDLRRTISICENAVRLTPDDHPDKPVRLQNLGQSLCLRFERFGDIDDLQQSVIVQEESIRLTPQQHPDKPDRLSALRHSVFLRFERLGELADVNHCIILAEDILEQTPDDHPAKPSRLTQLGHALRSRFEHIGDLGDLNRSVVQHYEALHLTPEVHASRRSYLMSLGQALHQRFEQLGDLDDLKQAILLYEDAVQFTPDGDFNKPTWLNNLGVALHNRFGRLGDPDDLKKSVQIAENAVRLIFDEEVEKPALLNNLSNALFDRFRCLGDIDDLNKSITTEEESIALTPDTHPERHARLNNLGMYLLRRFQELGDPADIQRSCMLGDDAIRQTPDGHPDKPAWLHNHSVSLQSRPKRNPEDLEEVINNLRSAAHSMTGPAHIRFYAAARWAHLAQIEANASVLDAYRTSLDLLPVLAWLGLSIKDRHYHIVRAGKVARNAAAAAIAAGLPGMAVEWLEQGRSIIWGQLLNLRTPVDDLRKSYPVLAEKFIFLSAQLEGTGIRGGELYVSNSSIQALNAQRSHDQALERNTLLEDIRRREGFTRFLLPTTMSELSKAAQGGPVVILNLSDNRCDALVLSPGTQDVVHIYLPEFTPEHAENLSQSLHRLVHHCGRTERLMGQQEGNLDPEEGFALILSELWTRLVKPVLNALKITTPATHNLQRVWWCPTGPLTFLPIHVAGIYGANVAFGSKLSDFVISSYTPSLTALVHGFRPRSLSQKPLQVLAVAQPSAQGQTYIPGTQAEITSIQKHATEKVPVLRLDANTATVDNVQAGMGDSSWVHFACHGVQSVSDPTDSALLLAGDSRLTLSSIIKLSLPDADFAFLSACQTATGDEVLQEEAVHLAGGILAAGYRGVIATMWTIMDSDAPQVTSDVYEHLLQDSPPDSRRAAEALHFAIKRLREGSGSKKSFAHWVPFIHIGV
ncbi:CHAT domain-containing protein [Mycena galopus ATCC 62051]|nr:CHAT domain-containing protein [Mycena galopus ATCC 62051]